MVKERIVKINREIQLVATMINRQVSGKAINSDLISYMRELADDFAVHFADRYIGFDRAFFFLQCEIEDIIPDH